MANGCQAIIWTNADPIYWRIYGALGVGEGDELRVLYGVVSSKVESISM